MNRLWWDDDYNISLSNSPKLGTSKTMWLPHSAVQNKGRCPNQSSQLSPHWILSSLNSIIISISECERTNTQGRNIIIAEVLLPFFSLLLACFSYLEDYGLSYNQNVKAPRENANMRSNKCNQCDFTISEAGNLRRHLKTHSGEKSNKCSQCGFVL